MPDLNLTGLDELALRDLREHGEVIVNPDRTVAVLARTGKRADWSADPHHPDGLLSFTQAAVAKVNPQPGRYRVPTAEEWAKESAVRALPNPWAKASWNLTQQLLLADQDPDLAQRFKAEANAK